MLVEAELGEIGGKDGAHAPGVRTDPDEAARFVAETGVDALAVAVGSSHAMTERGRRDRPRAHRAAARRAVPVPLVLHGSSGVPDDIDRARHPLGPDEDQRLDAPERAVHRRDPRRTSREHPAAVDSRKYVAAGREAVRLEAGRLLALFASARQGSEIG